MESRFLSQDTSGNLENGNQLSSPTNPRIPEKTLPMPPGNSPQLSKTRFMAGLQCLKRLYLECYDRDLADPVDETQQAIFDTGTGVGELAREGY